MEPRLRRGLRAVAVAVVLVAVAVVGVGVADPFDGPPTSPPGPVDRGAATEAPTDLLRAALAQPAARDHRRVLRLESGNRSRVVVRARVDADRGRIAGVINYSGAPVERFSNADCRWQRLADGGGPVGRTRTCGIEWRTYATPYGPVDAVAAGGVRVVRADADAVLVRVTNTSAALRLSSLVSTPITPSTAREEGYRANLTVAVDPASGRLRRTTLRWTRPDDGGTETVVAVRRFE
jgi:hypothetical protein